MDNRFLTLLNLVKTKNYTKTSQNLFISQPTVTHHIQSLEQEFNCKIFEIKNKQLVLTPEGKYVKEFAEKSFIMHKEFVSNIENLQNNVRKFKLGTSNNISSFYLLDIIKYWYKEHPDIKLDILIKDNVRLLESLENGECDFIITDMFFDQTKLEKKLLRKSAYALVCGNNHHLKYNENVRLKDIIDEKIYINPKNDLLLQNLKMRYHSVSKLKNAIILENYPLTKEVVIANLGISFIPRDLIINEILNEELFEIDFTEFKIDKEIFFVYNKTSIQHDAFNEIYQNFINLKKKYSKA